MVFTRRQRGEPPRLPVGTPGDPQVGAMDVTMTKRCAPAPVIVVLVEPPHR